MELTTGERVAHMPGLVAIYKDVATIERKLRESGRINHRRKGIKGGLVDVDNVAAR